MTRSNPQFNGKSLFRYIGGKWHLRQGIARLADDIPHRVYVEPFGGALNVLFAKKPAHIEIVNDSDEYIADFYRVLSDPDLFRQFRRRLRFVPYHRSFYTLSRFRTLYDPSTDIIGRSLDWYVAQCMTMRGHPCWGRDTWQTSTRRNHAVCWSRRLKSVVGFSRRLRRVTIECTDAVDVISLYDGPDTLFYVDPPYIVTNYYRHAFDIEQHERLCKTLRAARGKVILSTYPHPLYLSLIADGWGFYQRSTYGHSMSISNRKLGNRLELLGLNGNAIESLGGHHEAEKIAHRSGFHPFDAAGVCSIGEENRRTVACPQSRASSLA